MSQDVLLGTLFLMIGAGYETTVNLITSAVQAVLNHPETLTRIHEGTIGWQDVIEETLRIEGPIMHIPVRPRGHRPGRRCHHPQGRCDHRRLRGRRTRPGAAPAMPGALRPHAVRQGTPRVRARAPLLPRRAPRPPRSGRRPEHALQPAARSRPGAPRSAARTRGVLHHQRPPGPGGRAPTGMTCLRRRRRPRGPGAAPAARPCRRPDRPARSTAAPAKIASRPGPSAGPVRRGHRWGAGAGPPGGSRTTHQRRGRARQRRSRAGAEPTRSQRSGARREDPPGAAACVVLVAGAGGGQPQSWPSAAGERWRRVLSRWIPRVTRSAWTRVEAMSSGITEPPSGRPA